MNNQRRFLIMGCGSIGKRHLGNLQLLQAGDLLAYDPREDRRQEVTNQFGVPAVADLSQAWDWQPEVAFVTAPTSLHLSMAQQAAEHDCHLFVEKPLSHNLEGIPQLIETLEHRALISLVGCNMRFHPGIKAIKTAVSEGRLGQIVTVQAEVGQYLPDWHPWEDYRQGYSARQDLGGGVILDCIHEIDYLRWIFGDVASLACLAGQKSRLEVDVEDTAAILLQFASGIIGQVHLDYVQRSANRTCSVIGDEGTIRWSNSRSQVQIYESAAQAWTTVSYDSSWKVNQMYIDEIKHFLACLDGDEEPMQTVAEAAKALEIALAAKRSAADHCFIKC